MLIKKKSKRGTVIALLCALALLALVVLLENTMKPTGMLSVSYTHLTLPTTERV